MIHTDSSFDYLRFNLKYTFNRKEWYKKEFDSPDEHYFGYSLVRIATECQLLLDQFMEIAWQKTGDLDKKTPYVFFPVCDSEKKFKDHIKRMNVEEIEESYPDLFILIRNIQPFICGESWLHDQYHVASQRHSSPHLVYKSQLKKGTRISIWPIETGKSHSMSISLGNITKHASVRRWGIPDRPPPKVVLKSKDEAVKFVESSISGTNKIICDMIDCFERRLPR